MEQALKDKIKLYGIVAAVVLSGLFGFKACRKHDKTVDANTSNPVLKPGEKEKIIVDPVKHTITVVTPTGTNTTYLPDRPTSVTEDKDGKLTVQVKTWGTECRPYMGAGFDGHARLNIGLDGLYFHKFDFGGGLKLNPVMLKDTRLDINASWNFYSNTSLALSIDNQKTVEGFIKIRF